MLKKENQRTAAEVRTTGRTIRVAMPVLARYVYARASYLVNAVKRSPLGLSHYIASFISRIKAKPALFSAIHGRQEFPSHAALKLLWVPPMANLGWRKSQNEENLVNSYYDQESGEKHTNNNVELLTGGSESQVPPPHDYTGVGSKKTSAIELGGARTEIAAASDSVIIPGTMLRIPGNYGLTPEIPILALASTKLLRRAEKAVPSVAVPVDRNLLQQKVVLGKTPVRQGLQTHLAAGTLSHAKSFVLPQNVSEKTLSETKGLVKTLPIMHRKISDITLIPEIPYVPGAPRMISRDKFKMPTRIQELVDKNAGVEAKPGISPIVSQGHPQAIALQRKELYPELASMPSELVRPVSPGDLLASRSNIPYLNRAIKPDIAADRLRLQEEVEIPLDQIRLVSRDLSQFSSGQVAKSENVPRIPTQESSPEVGFIQAKRDTSGLRGDKRESLTEIRSTLLPEAAFPSQTTILKPKTSIPEGPGQHLVKKETEVGRKADLIRPVKEHATKSMLQPTPVSLSAGIHARLQTRYSDMHTRVPDARRGAIPAGLTRVLALPVISKVVSTKIESMRKIEPWYSPNEEGIAYQGETRSRALYASNFLQGLPFDVKVDIENQGVTDHIRDPGIKDTGLPHTVAQVYTPGGDYPVTQATRIDKKEAPGESGRSWLMDMPAKVYTAFLPMSLPVARQTSQDNGSKPPAITAAGSEEKDTGSVKPDIEAIAQDVYRILKRKLVNERERMLSIR